MTSDRFRMLVSQFLSGELPSAEQEQFETQLALDPELRAEVEGFRKLWDGLALLPDEQPSPALRTRFYQQLNALDRERSSAASKRLRWRIPMWQQLAVALCLFAMGVYVGQMKRAEGDRREEMVQMRAQVQNLREMVALSLLDQESATSRLEGVAWTSRVEQPNAQLVSALIATLNNDSNVNVRLSSLNALERFSANLAVERALVTSLQRQDSPLVQIAMIDLLVHIRNRAAGPELKKLTANMAANPAVRQRAVWGLQHLNFE